MWLFALFVAVPLIEIALFVTVGGWIGLWPTLAIVLGTAVLGISLMRMQGRQVVDQLRGAGPMTNPLSPMAHGALILLGGALLVLPGFFTDTLGLLLMIPLLRRLIITHLGRHITIAPLGGMPRRQTPDDGIIDAEFIEIDPEQVTRRSGPSGWTRP